MAKFPIKRTTKQLSSPKAPDLRLDTDTGSAARAAAHRAVQDALDKWTNRLRRDEAKANQMHEDSELSRVKREADEDLFATKLRISENPDPAAYDKAKDDYIARTRARTDTLPSADTKTAFNVYVDGQQRFYDNTFESLRQIRIKRNHAQDWFEISETAVDTNDMTAAATYVADMVKRGEIEQKEADAMLAELHNEAQFVNAQKVALSTPEQALELIGDDSSTMEGFEDLTPGQVTAIRATAEGTINYNERRAADANNALMDDLFQHALKGTPVDEMQRLIKQTVGISATEKIELLQTYLQAYELVNVGKGNPYQVTQDWPKFFETQKKLEADGASVSDNEINNGTGKYWTYNQRQQLMNIKYPHQENPALQTPFAEEWIKQVDVMYMDENKDIPAQDIAEWAGLRQQVEAVLRRYPDDYKKAQTEIEALMKPTKKMNAKSLLEKGLLEKGLLLVPPLLVIDKLDLIPPPPKLKPQSMATGMFGMFPQGEKSKELPKPKTQAEYDKLPKGTRYIHPDLGEQVKQ